MASKHFANKARRAWWSVHVEAWQRSGLSQRAYCRRHGLTQKTFVRWMRVLVDERALRAKAELEREERLERRRRRGGPVSKDKRCKAVQAFWAMHIEAMSWSGMGVREYAMGHRISLHSLRRWRDLLDNGDVTIDWRALLHPSARPNISTRLSTSAKDGSPEYSLTDVAATEPAPDGRSNRRRFSAEEKLAIVLETERPGVTVSQVARNHRIVTSVLFRWRAELGFGKGKAVDLAPVRVAGETLSRGTGGDNALVLQDVLAAPAGMAAFDLPDGRRVFAPAGADPDAVRRHVAVRESAQ